MKKCRRQPKNLETRRSESGRRNGDRNPGGMTYHRKCMAKAATNWRSAEGSTTRDCMDNVDEGSVAVADVAVSGVHANGDNDDCTEC